jgi:endonuclease IV
MFGVHIRKHNTVSDSLADSLAESRKSLPRELTKSAQVFITNPRSGAEITTREDIAGIRKFVEATNTELIIHSSYVGEPWGKCATGIVRREFALATQCGASGLVVHMGSKTNSGYKCVIESIMRKIPSETLNNVILWLEINAAKSSENTFETPQKINNLFRKIYALTHKSPLLVGLCIDSAHLWACGVSFTTYNSADSFLKGLDKRIPIMFHLNDSTEELGSGIDVHAQLARGKIWDNVNIADSGIACIVNYAEEHGSIIILERNLNESGDYTPDINALKVVGVIS